MAPALFHSRERPARPRLPAIAPVTADDRILILAPHEDDETLGAGGVIQRALAVGAAVRVVYLTYGDHNELAFMAYRKRPLLSPEINRRMGEVRRREAIAAMAHLGLPENNLVFLGYPDNGTLAIWKKHWGDYPPLLSILTNTTHVPYADAASFGKPYKGEEIVADIEKQLLEFGPTRVIVTHPADGNPDHRSYYLFLQVALLDLGNRLQAPEVIAYPVHMGPWPRPHYFHPEDFLAWPDRLANDESPAWIFELPPGDVRRKYEAICLYRSQMTDCEYWLTTFARRNELFTTPLPLALRPEPAGTGPHSAAAPTGATAAYERDAPATRLAGVSYIGSEEGLVARVILRRSIEREMGVSVCAFGYRRDTPFARMPKIHAESILGQIRVHDGGERVPNAPVAAGETSREATFTIPWGFLGDPEIIFAQARGIVGGAPVSQTAWKVLTNAGACALNAP